MDFQRHRRIWVVIEHPRDHRCGGTHRVEAHTDTTHEGVAEACGRSRNSCGSQPGQRIPLLPVPIPGLRRAELFRSPVAGAVADAGSAGHRGCRRRGGGSHGSVSLHLLDPSDCCDSALLVPRGGHTHVAPVLLLNLRRPRTGLHPALRRLVCRGVHYRRRLARFSPVVRWFSVRTVKRSQGPLIARCSSRCGRGSWCCSSGSDHRGN